MSIYRTFPGSTYQVSVVEYLNNSSFDEMVEIDLARDRCHNIYHTEGKYFVPLLDASYTGMYSYAKMYMVHAEDRQVYEDLMNPATIEVRLAEADTPGVRSAQFRYKMLDGSWRWVEQVLISGDILCFAPGIVRFYVFDIQSQRNRKLGLVTTYPSGLNHDDLTGLLKEKTFLILARDMSLNQEADWCILSLDIEEFGLFNGWYGHEMGDFLLAQIGSMLKMEENRFGGLACYQGNDDFCMLIPYDKERIERIYEQMLQLIRSKSQSMGFLPSIGICMIKENKSIQDTLNKAALARARLKGNFRTRICLYDPSIMSNTREEYQLLSDFQQGLRNREFVFYLQPQCKLSTGKIMGVEALARWRNPDGTMRLPDSFIPVLEKYGFITDFDCYIWEQVCIWLRAFMDRGNRPIPVSINVSRIDIFTIDVVEFLEALVQEYRIPMGILKVEITESSYASDVEKVGEVVRELRRRGFPVLMDDFGSGYSSLNMLRNLEMDVIKLDGQFLRFGSEDETKGIHILENIINLTKTMAIPIIVEGVETAEQAEFLEGLGCSYVQGYHYYRPMQVAEFEGLVADESLVDYGKFEFKANQQFRIREFMDENIYSDTMLNNILGATAFYSWDGKERVDIIRFNEQFYRLVNVPQFDIRLNNIQRFFVPEDVPRFFTMVRNACENRMNGASGIFGVYRTEESVGRFYLQFYYLEDRGERKIFYGTMREVTKLTELQNSMRLLSLYASVSIVFQRRTKLHVLEDGVKSAELANAAGAAEASESKGADAAEGMRRWFYQVVVHGLEKQMGMSAEELQKELNDCTFYERIDEGMRENVREHIQCGEGSQQSFSLPLTVRNPKGEWLDLYLKKDYIHDVGSDVEYVLMFRPWE